MRRYATYKRMVDNVPIVGVAQSFLTMAAGKADFHVIPASDTEADKKDAEDLRAMLFGPSNETPMDYFVKTMAMHALNGFALMEWDGMLVDGELVIKCYRQIPPETVPRFEYDMKTTEVVGFVQRTFEGYPDTTIPRWKTVYVVDSSNTASPRGRGKFQSVGGEALKWMKANEMRHAALISNLRGRPWVYAPIREIHAQVEKEIEASEEKLTPDEIKARQDARVREALSSVIGVTEQGDTGPDWTVTLDSAAVEGETYQNDQKPINLRQWSMEFKPDRDVQTALADSEARQLDMARQLHLVYLMRGDLGGGSYALADTQLLDALGWIESVMQTIVNEINRLSRWLWAWNGRSGLCPKWGVKESSFMTTHELGEILKLYRDVVIGNSGGMGPGWAPSEALLAAAGMPTGNKVEPYQPPTMGGSNADD